jgi:hypothetical protein
MASTFTKCRFERVHGISSPGMLSTSENVDLGDASVGVARNPLRDGALPTGHFTGRFFSFLEGNAPSATAKSTKSLASLHRVEGQLVHDLGDGV